MFITIYGINNIGKTYHAKRLAKRLRRLKKKAVYIKYPIYKQAPTGIFLNKVLRQTRGQNMREEELQLWFTLNRYQFQPTLEKMLKQRKFVIAEDYVGTGIAWGVAKGADMTELENMNKYLVQSDVSVLLDGDRKIRSREEKHIHERNDRLVERCRCVFLKLAKKYGWKIVRVDEDKDVTAARIWRAIAKYV